MSKNKNKKGKKQDQLDVKIKWDVIENNPLYLKGLKRISKSGRYEDIKAQINTFKKIIKAGKVFNRDKSEIENLDLDILTDHKLADYELKFKNSDNNLRLLYSVVLSDTIIYNEEEGEYQKHHLVVFIAIGTHSQVKTGSKITI